MQPPLIQGTFIMQKMDMKGGWTFVVLPSHAPKTGNPFGWFIVQGTIDDVPISQFKLWPTKEGKFFLPIKASIRKVIKKQVGDKVIITLWEDNSPLVIPEEFTICVHESPKAETFFNTLSDTSKKQFVDYIYSSKSILTRANRIAKTIEKLEQRKKWHEM